MEGQRAIPTARCHLQALLDEIPEQDRTYFVRAVLLRMEHLSRDCRALRPNFVFEEFLVCFSDYNGDRDNIRHHGTQIEYYYNDQETQAETLSLIRATERELAPVGNSNLVPAGDGSDASSSLSDSVDRGAAGNYAAIA